MKPAQDLQSKWEACCSPDDFNRVKCKTPSSSLTELEVRSRCPTYYPQLIFYHSCTTNHLLPQFRALFNSHRQKDHMSKSWSPLRWAHEFWHWTVFSWVQPTRMESPVLTCSTCSVFSKPALGSGSVQGQSHHLPWWQASTRACRRCHHQGEVSSTWWHPAPCCNPWP